MTERLTAAAAALTAIFALNAPGAPALASDDLEKPERACWAATDGAVHTSVCFGGPDDGLFALMWTTGEGSSRSVGTCIGQAEILYSEGAVFEWQVPSQADRCYQDTHFARMARRNYDCVMAPDKMTCVMRIYLQDGRQWGTASTDVVLRRR